MLIRNGLEVPFYGRGLEVPRYNTLRIYVFAKNYIFTTYMLIRNGLEVPFYGRGLEVPRYNTLHLTMEKRTFYRRNLPHLQPDNSVFFITARLKGSLPKEVILRLKEEHELQRKELKEQGLSKKELTEEMQKSYDLYFGRFDDLLDSGTTGPHWLKADNIAEMWTNALNYFDNERYKVICSTVMSNHVHFIFYKLDRPLNAVLQSLKSFSANEMNKALQRSGNFWQPESFDRVIRNRTELEYRINYVLDNPVKVGIVPHWSAYRHNYIHPDFKKYVK